MRLGRTKIATFLLCFSVACIVPRLVAKKKDQPDSNPDAQKRALHALNRLTFGPRPGDVQQVMAMGVEQWIDLQLHPEKIDDRAVNARLEPLRTLRMSTREIAEDFPDGQEITQVRIGKKPMPSDPARRAVFQVQLARQEEKKERKEEAGKNPVSKAAPDKAGRTLGDDSMMAANGAADGASGSGPHTGTNAAMNGASDTMSSSGTANDAAADAKSSTPDQDTMATAAPAPAKLTPEEEERARRREEQLYTDLDVQQLPSLPPDQRFKKVLSMSLEGQVALADSLRGGKGKEFLEGLAPRQKEILLAMNNPGGVVTGELAQAKLLRAIYSQRQFEEVITDFWCNHFNVFVDKGLDRLMLTSYERDVIRPHALGKFEDLLVATAKSPAMLYYLDNYLSVGPNSPQALGLPLHPNGPYWRRYPDRPPRPNQGKRKSGLNENYGRELMELHTLSVN